MRSLAVWTTTAAVALLGVASGQDAAPAAEQTQAGELRSAVNAYAAYQADITELRGARVGTAAELEAAIDHISRHNRDALTRGWVAYGAYAAAQSPAFVQGVRDAAAYYGRDAVIWAVTVDPSYARGLRGGQEATRLLLESANADSQRIIAVADRFQELAYSMQRQRWANAVAPQQAARVQRVRSLAATGAPADAVPAEFAPRLNVAPLSASITDPTAYGGRGFWDALRGGEAVVQVAATTQRWTVNHTRGEALDRMAAVAALQALEAVDANQSAVSRLLADPRSRDCIEMAQLQLYQCMSAARFRYENTFCLGQHAMRDVGRCIGAVGQPDTAAMTPVGGGGAGRPD